MDEIALLSHDVQRRNLQDMLIRALYEQLSTDKSIIIDGGANIGLHTVPMARKAYQGKVIAFEPHPVLAKYLRRLCSKLELSNVSVYQEALSERVGKVEFSAIMSPGLIHPLENTVYSSVRLREDVRARFKVHEIEVKTTTIDSVVKSCLMQVDFIKLDVEGYEYLALRGATESISTHRPIIIFEDPLYSRSHRSYADDEGVLKTFKAFGYSLLYLTGHNVDEARWLVRDQHNHRTPLNLIAFPQEIISQARIREIIDGVYISNGLSELW